MAAPSPLPVSDAATGGGYTGPSVVGPKGGYSTKQSQVKLAAGQVMHYSPGKGYYAGPPVRAGKAPPPGTDTPPVGAGDVAGMGADAPGTINQEATKIANADLLPQQQAIKQAQAQADAQALAQQKEIADFQTGAAGILAGVAPTVGAGWNAAAAQEGNIGAEAAQGAGQTLADAQGQNAQLEALQGQTGGSTVSAPQLSQTLGQLNAVIPGDATAQEGAAAQQAAAAATQLPIDAGNEEIAKAMADARTQDDNYAQQLLSIAQQFPNLKATALQQLNQYELDKANYRLSAQTAETNKYAAQTQRMAEQTNARLAEGKSALAQSNVNREFQYKYASLNLRSQEDAIKLQQAQQKGKTIDVQASKLLGHVVYKDGTQDPSIHVQQSTASNPHQKAIVARARSMQTASVDAYKAAVAAMGKPTTLSTKMAQSARALQKQVGQYVAAPTQKYGVPGGVFPPVPALGIPATTNNPARAERAGGTTNMAALQAKVFAAIGGSTLMQRYGLSRAQIMALVNQQIKAALAG